MKLLYELKLKKEALIENCFNFNLESQKKPQNPTTDNFILMSENTRDHYVQYCMPI